METRPADTPLLIRDATIEDLPSILRLNSEFEHFLSPADASRIAYLYSCAGYRRVLESGSQIVGFLFAMGDNSAYDGDNYKWFSERYGTFLYVDRIAIAREYQGQRQGQRFYTDLFLYAQHVGIGDVTCEVDVGPPNEVSLRFHQRLGFREVGMRTTVSKKLVSLQVASLVAAR